MPKLRKALPSGVTSHHLSSFSRRKKPVALNLLPSNRRTDQFHVCSFLYLRRANRHRCIGTCLCSLAASLCQVRRTGFRSFMACLIACERTGSTAPSNLGENCLQIGQPACDTVHPGGIVYAQSDDDSISLRTANCGTCLCKTVCAGPYFGPGPANELADPLWPVCATPLSRCSDRTGFWSPNETTPNSTRSLLSLDQVTLNWPWSHPPIRLAFSLVAFPRRKRSGGRGDITVPRLRKNRL